MSRRWEAGNRQPRNAEGWKGRERGRARGADFAEAKSRSHGSGGRELRERERAQARTLVLAHERLDVYRLSIEFLALSARLIGELPGGYGSLADELRRAALSIPLNIAEGAGKTAKNDKKRFYGIARGSTMECAAVMDAIKVLNVSERRAVDKGKEYLVRIASMLTKLAM